MRRRGLEIDVFGAILQCLALCAFHGLKITIVRWIAIIFPVARLGVGHAPSDAREPGGAGVECVGAFGRFLRPIGFAP